MAGKRVVRSCDASHALGVDKPVVNSPPLSSKQGAQKGRLWTVLVHILVSYFFSFIVYQTWFPSEHLAGSLPAIPGSGRNSQDMAAGE